jgi:hypothetical protein
MKKALRKEIQSMLITSINITLNTIDEKAAGKISRSVEKAAEKLTKRFAKKLKMKGKVKEDVSKLVGRKRKKALQPVEATAEKS